MDIYAFLKLIILKLCWPNQIRVGSEDGGGGGGGGGIVCKKYLLMQKIFALEPSPLRFTVSLSAMPSYNFFTVISLCLLSI